MNGLLGRKLGMTRVFDEDGKQIPVTAVEVGPCTVVRRKTTASDGYEAVQLGYLEQKKQRMRKPDLGQFAAIDKNPMRHLGEVRLDAAEDVEVGATITADAVFKDVAFVDVVGTTKGRGFQGVVKRHGMSGGRASHGSGMHRRPGSIGQCVSPARVQKNKRMPGQFGNVRVTTQNIKVVRLMGEDNVLLLYGSVPGPTGGVVFVRKAIKKKAAKAS